ncbi:MAG: HD domain-containing protein [Chitinophagaceae bacterium]|jgi:phosphonate degradation associated HDIG domain protein|nr:HD domain-containing protein [Chitinophagaceae bacterium]MCA6478404.1 HD domain-containing protein [Chitinophagaceae bacterium]MCA6489298.1 HD domain-containing protein [Chitinophagaceae bacterium]MCA6513474.1 HD domain-containing protein [Chitinophagaceae bacterium]
MDKATIIASEIIQLFQQFGNSDYIGEKVSQVQHMTQCAILAESEGYDEETILAAFLHDIGHLLEYKLPVSRMNQFGVVDHEAIGSRYLASQGFSNRIYSSVDAHVRAKRYLTHKFPNYYNGLSEASKATLMYQGGSMNENEARDFEQEENFELYVLIRQWDDKAKNPEISVPDLSKYETMIKRHLNSQII